jgi:hypothetical protein
MLYRAGAKYAKYVNKPLLKKFFDKWTYYTFSRRKYLIYVYAGRTVHSFDIYFQIFNILLLNFVSCPKYKNTPR